MLNSSHKDNPGYLRILSGDILEDCKEMNVKKLIYTLLILINVIGISCLVHFGALYLSHGTNIANPDAMLPMPDWERGGLALTIGVIPLLVANLALMMAVRQYEDWVPARKVLLGVFLIPGVICAMLSGSFLLLDLTGCSNGDNEGKPVVSVAIADNENREIKYINIYTDREDADIEKFTPDDVKVYTADIDDFNSQIAGGTKIKVSLVRNLVYEGKSSAASDDNDPVHADETVTAVMKAVCDSEEHEIFELSVWQDEDRYFAFYDLNVNLWTPCKLVEYDPSSGTLTELGEWDNVDLLNIRLPF